MSAADLFVDGFPHGTPAGYLDGCKSNGCPARQDFGMSCRMAWQAERSDRRYRRLADEGAPPPVIALELGMVEREQLSPSAAVDVAAWSAGLRPVPPEQLADAARTVTDAPTPTPAAVDVSRPSRIRAWAREQGIPVAAFGKIRREVIDAFDAAHSTPEEPGMVIEGVTVDGVMTIADGHLSIGSLTFDPDAAVTFAGSIQVDDDKTPAPEHTGHTEHTPREALPAADFGQAMVDVDVAAARDRADRLERENAELVQQLTEAEADYNALLSRHETGDVERARRIAVHLEQLQSRTEDERDRALAEVHTLIAELDRLQRVAASAEAESAALRRAWRERPRRARVFRAWVRRVVTR